MDFVAIDFETANEDLTSVCQVGIALFKSGKLTDQFSTLINPKDEFSFINTSIHGIKQSDVKKAPVFKNAYSKIFDFLNNNIVVSHTHFDRAVLLRTADRHSLNLPEIQWLDSAKVVRRTWKKYERKGYGLGNVTKDLGISFKHHDALEDAIAAGKVLLKACEFSGIEVEEWVKKTTQPITKQQSVKRSGSIAGILSGETIVFTGSLSLARKDAANIAALAGCNVGSSVTKETTILVVGDQDISKLKKGHNKSSKHLKAEMLLQKGQNIKIIKESDFKELVKL